MKRSALNGLLTCALLAGASHASAETSATPNALEGTDALNMFMDLMLVDLGIVNGSGVETYNGLGSSCGERQMIGNPTGSEPACTDTNGGENVGCQEISPMSREMGSSVCSAGNSEAIGQAEGIVVCRDNVVVISDNATFGQYATDAAACAAFSGLANTSNAGSPPEFTDHGAGRLAQTGTLPITGYTLGAGMPADQQWRDVLRVIYTGCLQGDGDCITANGSGNTSAGVPSRKRTERCGSAIRRELLSDWRYILEGEPCGERCEVDLTDGQTALPGHRADDGVDDTGLRHAFRRDDSSGTTGVFLEFIGVRANLTGRPKITATALESVAATGCSAGRSPASAKLITQIPEHHSYCDGGHLENWAPDCHNDTIIPIGGDPIRKSCAEADDLCGPDGKAAVVQAIKSARGANPYPTHQCSRGQFAKRNYLASPHNVCPDGSKPASGQCKLPFFSIAGGGQNFDCLNPFNSRPSTVPTSTDGRAYNFVMRSTTGVVDQGNYAGSIEVASWRQNTASMVLSGTQNIFGKAYAAADYECRELDATLNISCLISKSTCSIGYAGRAAAYSTANNQHFLHEPFWIHGAPPSNAASMPSGGYPLTRSQWFNAIGGMESITAQCLARGDTMAFCTEQTRIAEEFWGNGLPGNMIGALCEESGYIALPRSEVYCKGPTATCGAPLSQPLTDCIPQ